MIIIILRLRVPWSVIVSSMNDLSCIWFCLPSQFHTYPVYFYTLLGCFYILETSVNLSPPFPLKKNSFQAFSKAFFFNKGSSLPAFETFHNTTSPSGNFLHWSSRGGRCAHARLQRPSPARPPWGLRPPPPFARSYGNSWMATSSSVRCLHPHTSPRCRLSGCERVFCARVCAVVSDTLDTARWRWLDSWLVCSCTAAWVSCPTPSTSRPALVHIFFPTTHSGTRFTRRLVPERAVTERRVLAAERRLAWVKQPCGVCVGRRADLFGVIEMFASVTLSWCESNLGGR